MQTISSGTDRLEENGRVFIRVASVAELEQRPFKVVTLEDRHVLLLRADGQIRALDSRCPHMGYPLSQGTIRDGVLRCHWHHWRFGLAYYISSTPICCSMRLRCIRPRRMRALTVPRGILQPSAISECVHP